MLNDAVPDDLVRKYAWVDEIDAWTVAVIEGRTPDEVLYIYGGEPDQSVGEYTFAEMFPLQGNGEPHLRFHVQMVSTPSHVVTLENNGWSGSLPEITRRCSVDRRRFFSVYWNVNAFGLLTRAIDGVVTARVESLYPVAPDAEPHEIRPSWLIGPETDVNEAWQTCMALMEQQTGVAIDPAWLTERRPTYEIPDPHWMLRDVPNADKP